MSYHFQANHPSETAKLAHALAAVLRKGSVVALSGNLAAGKTFFSQAFAKAWGVTETVSSPTFTIIKEYQGKVLPLYHMDVYRVSVEEADELGLEEYFFGEGVSLVEWADQIIELLPQEYLSVQIHKNQTDIGAVDRRHIVLTPHGKRYEQICHELYKQGVIDH